MKKLNLLKLLFCAIAMFAASAFTSCVDDNADNGMPYLEVTPDVLQFTLAGEPVGASSVVVKTNRPWELTIENGDWVTASATSGTGDATVEFVVPASTSGQAATLSFSLKNTYGAYLTREVVLEQGEIGAVSRLNSYIKSTWPTDPESDVALGYGETTIDGYILANNADGNNRSKLYVGDNVTQPNSAVILFSTEYNTPANYPVGSKVKLDLSNAKYAPYLKLRELKDVVVTVTSDPVVEVKVPSLTAAQLNTGNYQGQYVKVNDVTPAAGTVGKPWATSSYQTLDFNGAGGAKMAVYMRGASDVPAFANLSVVQNTGVMFGVAEQYNTTIQLLPTKVSDITGFFDAQPTVTTLEATNIDKTSATLNGSLVFIQNVTEVGFQYLPFAATPDWTAATTVKSTLADGKWSAALTNLTQGQKYSFRAYVKAAETYYGEAKTFTPDIAATVTIDFSDANAYPSDFPVESKNKILDATVYTFSGYQMTFAGAGTGNGFYTPKKDYLLWGKQGGYVLLPAIANKSLVRVRCSVPAAASGNVQVGIFDKDGTGAIQGGEVIPWPQDGENDRVYLYDLGGTAVNTPYRVQIANGYNAQLLKLELWYNDGATPGKPSITVDPAQLTFGAAADNTGQTVAVTVENAGALNLYFKSTDATQFPMTYDAASKTLTVKALANDDETNSKTATITAYLAETEGGAYTYSADIAVSQAPRKPKTVAELVTFIKSADVNPAFGTQAALTKWNGTIVEGYIAANNAGKNLNNMLAVIDQNGTANAGVILYDTSYNTTADYPVGTKVRITITADTYCKNNYGMLRLEKATVVVDNASTITINPVEITASQFNSGNYLGMYVKITGLKYKESAPQQWNPGSSTSTASQSFVAGADEVIIRTYGGCSWATDYISTTKTNGTITGVGQVYQGSATAEMLAQLNPQSEANVADFMVTAPMIVEVNPVSVTLPGAGGTKDVEVTILNQGSNALTTSGLTAPFSASVTGNVVTVSAPANTTGNAIPMQTLTISLAGGNSVTVPVDQLAPGAKDYDKVTTIGELSAGNYLIGGNGKSGTLQLFTGSLSSGHGVTSLYDYDETTGTLTTSATEAATVTIEAVSGVANAYRIVVGGKYLIATGTKSGTLSLVDAGAAGADNYWNFTNGNGGIKALQTGTADGAQILISNATDANILRSGATVTSGNGIVFFKKN